MEEVKVPEEREIKYIYDVEINDVQILATEEITDKEAVLYYRKYKEKKPGLYKLYLEFDGDFVNVTYQYKERGVPFERIRRITGYLVGTTDRWNDAKKVELSERTKHGV